MPGFLSVSGYGRGVSEGWQASTYPLRVSKPDRNMAPTDSPRLRRRRPGLAAFPQPRGQLVRLAALGGGCGGKVVVPDPRRVGPAVEQQLGGLALPPVRGAPQRVVEVLP